MGRRKKEYTCKNCGKKYAGYRKSGTCSAECGIQRMYKLFEQIRRREGPHYKKWLRGMNRYMEILERERELYHAKYGESLREFLQTAKRRLKEAE